MSEPQSPLPPPAQPQTRQSMPMLFPIFIIFFLFACFLSIFLFQDLFHCFRRGQRNRNTQSNNGRSHNDSGLDPVIISSFPTLPYFAVRGLQEGKCGAECAVCLSEFNAGDVIRLLTVCCHAFHPTCIDSWLALHTSCPICRSDLEAPPDEAAVLAVQVAASGGGIRDSHVISVEDEIKTSSRDISTENGER